MISATYRKFLAVHLRVGVALCLIMAALQLGVGWGSLIATSGGVLVALFSSTVLVCACTILEGNRTQSNGKAATSTRSAAWVAVMAIIKLPLLLIFLYLISRFDRQVFWSGIIGVLSAVPAIVMSGLMSNKPIADQKLAISKVNDQLGPSS